MIPRRTHIFTAVATLLLGAPLYPQTATPSPSHPSPQPQTAPQPKPQPAVYRNLILLDPAHGGTDTGTHLPNTAVEKDLTLAFAARLRPLLSAAGFTVLTTHDTDVDLVTDQRAGIANHARAAACLIFHATASGSGIHIATSSLADSFDYTPSHTPLAWDTAQTASIPQSLRLANEIGLSLNRAKLPVLLIKASTPPLDNLTCPAIAIEIAPLISGDNSTPVTDAAYQQQAAQAIATALSSYRTHNTPATNPTGAAR